MNSKDLSTSEVVKEEGNPHFDVSSVRCTSSIAEQVRTTYTVAFSPRGDIIAITGGSTVYIFEFASDGSLVYRHKMEHEHDVNDVKFHPDPDLPYIVICCNIAKLYRISDDKTFKLISIQEARQFESKTVRIPFGSFLCAAFNPTGKHVILGCSNFCIYSYSFTDDCCTLHQRLDRTTESSMSGHFDYVCTLLFHPSGQLFFSGSDDKTVKVWRISKTGFGSCVGTIEHHTDNVRGIAIDSKGKYLMTSSSDNTVNIYEIDTMRRVSKIKTGNTRGITDCVFHPTMENVIVIGSYDGRTIFYQLSDDRKTSTVLKILTHHSSVISLAFNPIKPNRLVIGLSENYDDRTRSTVEIYELPVSQ